MYEIGLKPPAKIVNPLTSIGFSHLSDKGPASVHISDTRGLFFQTIAADFAVKSTAADIKTPGRFMFVPVGFLEYIGN